MTAGPARADWSVARPAPALRPLVRRYVGYHFEGYPPGVHLGLPAPELTVVICLDEPLELVEMPDPRQAPGRYQALVSGLATRRAAMRHHGRDHGVQLELTPLGARSLLGLPAGALGAAVVDLAELLGPAASSLPERLAASRPWAARFALLDAVLGARIGRRPPPPSPLLEAWRQLVDGGGAARVGAVAAQVGWSRRHLGERFAREYGVTPKEAARLARFARACELLRRPGAPNLAHVAADAGYYDQSHLVRDWWSFAGCPPSTWLAQEQLPSVQDGGG